MHWFLDTFRSSALELLYYVALWFALCMGMVLTVTDSPGIWVMVAAMGGYAYLTWPHQYVGWVTLGVLAALAVGSELADSMIGNRQARRSKSGKLAGLSAFIGGMLGGCFLTFLIPVPPFGTIAGICVGCAAGAMLFEMLGGKKAKDAFAVGAGAARARLLGILTKTGFAIVIFLTSIYVAFPTFWKNSPTPATPQAKHAAPSHKR